MKRARNPRTGLPCPVTRCPKCQREYPGRTVGGREPTCPDCPSRVVGDAEPQRAKFAPGRGTRVPNLGSEPEEEEA